jgi:tRNA A37 threonylcarbamoyladenosine dehydratase
MFLDKNEFVPLILDPNNDEHKLTIESIKENKHYQILDTIDCQMKELIEIDNPSVNFTNEEFNIEIKKLLGGLESNDYGVWVYYKWLNTMIHILKKEDFVKVRTNRNRNKITEEEQAKLSEKVVGIVGMSVGSSIARTLTLERSCGVIRLSDFDDLELSNLNRIQASLMDIGVPKVVICARQIAVIDPFIKVEVFNQGINSKNIDDFYLNTSGKLDLIYDECDNLEIKFSIRNQANKHRVPLVMDTSDNGMIDVERFDLTRDLPIFHGKIDKYIESPSPEEQVEMISVILGEENLSDELKASFFEINKTIKSWPQLGSDVTSGAGHAVSVGRKILLGDEKLSGKYLIKQELV